MSRDKDTIGYLNMGFKGGEAVVAVWLLDGDSTEVRRGKGASNIKDFYFVVDDERVWIRADQNNGMAVFIPLSAVGGIVRKAPKTHS